MKIEKLNFQNFRNIKEISLSNFEKMNIICGQNAQGKTNLLEGIWLFTGAKSFRNVHDADFIRFGCEQARLEINFFADGIKQDAAITVKEKRTAFLNGNRLKTASEMAGTFHAVVFSPADLSIIQDGPAFRRRFLDLAIGQLTPSYIPLLRDYLRAVTQRNHIIKEIRYDASLSIMLEIFEKEIAEKGTRLIAFRKKYIAALQEFLPAIYCDLSSGKESFELHYQCSCEQNFTEVLEKARKNDMLTGSTSVGPHRDDLIFTVNGVSAKIYGSQGQKRSAALALRLGEAELIKKVTGEVPVFLLDDVMSELDPERRHYILNHMKEIQCFLTCCNPDETTKLKKGKIIRIQNGSVMECTSI